VVDADVVEAVAMSQEFVMNEAATIAMSGIAAIARAEIRVKGHVRSNRKAKKTLGENSRRVSQIR
jgi:hypothetical protein